VIFRDSRSKVKRAEKGKEWWSGREGSGSVRRVEERVLGVERVEER